VGVKVRQKVKGRGNPWWVFISHNGQRTSRKVGLKAVALAAAAQIEANITLGTFNLNIPKAAAAFKEYADSWIKITVPGTCKESTVEDYKNILRLHVLPIFGDLNVTDINRGMVKGFLLDKINKGYAKSTVSHMKNVISGILNKALDDEIIQANPALQLGKNFLKAKNSYNNVNILTSNEVKHLLKTVKIHFTEHYALILLLARTGMRIGEALALKWGDLDFNGRFIEVKRSYVRCKITTPKSGKTRRVDMSLQLSETLKTHELESKKKSFALGLGNLTEYIFTNREGRLIDKNNWRRRIFYKALNKAKLRKIRIHDLRHTYATLRISKGDNIADVSNQLGHHSVKLTMDVYYQWFPGKKKEEVDGLDDPDFLHPFAPYMHPTPSESKKVTE